VTLNRCTHLLLILHIDLDVRLATLVNNLVGYQLGVTLHLLVLEAATGKVKIHQQQVDKKHDFHQNIEL
jgi:hypothetical protein